MDLVYPRVRESFFVFHGADVPPDGFFLHERRRSPCGETASVFCGLGVHIVGLHILVDHFPVLLLLGLDVVEDIP